MEKTMDENAHRRLDVDGYINIPVTRPRVRVPAREVLVVTWHEACAAVDEVLRHFGNRKRDRGIWVWYCRRIGAERFLDLAYEVECCWKNKELRHPARALQRHLMEAFPKEGAK